MRSSTLALVVLVFVHSSAALRHPIAPRQATEPASGLSRTPTPVRSSTDASQAPSSPVSSPLSTTEAKVPQSTDAVSKTPTSTPATSVTLTPLSPQTTASTISNGITGSLGHTPTPSALNGTTPSNPLPIHPKLSPAMGISGVVLLLSGLAYTLIGIRNKWLYVSMSAAYLATLAVTVLIIYLMNPPVTDAVQGAFFVAATVTGLIFGALALVFPDMTDGLGCMLGGFCLSMWFLTLREGGLIHSTTGRIIFMVCMTAVAFAFSFTHYTRRYALIGGIAFGGATAIVLGIDCLSRAGLKEFWIYVWDLNPDEFPLDTTTYPVTRAIKVEIACIIIFCIFGIISQLQLWNIVEERRRKRRAGPHYDERQEPTVTRDEDGEIARKLQERLIKERERWEATYGEKESGFDDSALGSSNSSHQRRSSESIEMKQMSGTEGAKPRHSQVGPTVTVTSVGDDEIQLMQPRTVHQKPQKRPSVQDLKRTSSGNVSARVSRELRPSASGELGRRASARSSLHSLVPPAAILVSSSSTEESETSLSKRANNNPASPVENAPWRSPLLKQLSNGSISNRLSIRRSVGGLSESVEALIEPEDEDRRSSVAATLNDEYDIDGLPELSPSNSLDLKSDQNLEGPSANPGGENNMEQSKQDASYPLDNLKHGQFTETTDSGFGGKVLNVMIPEATLRILDEPGSGLSSPAKACMPDTPIPGISGKTEGTQSQRESRISQGVQSISTGMDRSDADDPTQPFRPTKSQARSSGSQFGSPHESLKEALPDKLSKTALSFRTTEWAKHLEQAEKPEIEDIPEPESPGVQVSHVFPEAPAPINQELLQQDPPSKPKKVSLIVKPSRDSILVRSASNMSRYSQGDLMSNSQSPASSAGPFPAPAAKSGASRRASARQIMPLTESPIEEGSKHLRFTPSPSGPGTTLLEKRETFLQTKSSTPTLSPYASSQNLMSMAKAADRPSSKLMHRDSANLAVEKTKPSNPDEMTLAQRRELLLRSSTPSASQSRLSRTPSASQENILRRVSGSQTRLSRPPSTSQNLAQSNWAGFDAHKPKRPNSLDQETREVRLANWREAMRQDKPATTTPAPATEFRRTAMIHDNRQKEAEKQQQAMANSYRDAMMENMMRSGEMLDAHQAAMRRLQDKANKRLS